MPSRRRTSLTVPAEWAGGIRDESRAKSEESMCAHQRLLNN
jgi:hypothetical protein